MAGQIIRRAKKDPKTGELKDTENTWLVRIFIGRESDGKRKYHNKTIHGTKKDAQKYLTAKLREKDLGIFVEPASESLSKYLDRWLLEIAKPRLRTETFNSYKQLVDNYIGKHLGTKKLSQLQGYQIQKFYNDMQREGLSARTVRYCHSVLSSALKQAVRWKMIFQNPCNDCDLPKMQKTEMKYYTPGEVKKFLETAKADRLYVLFYLALETGTRPGEYLGLQWKDIDFEQGSLTVRRVVKVQKGGGFYFAEPKTKKSRRSIPLSDPLITALKKHRMIQLEAKMKIRDCYQDSDLIFATEIGTPFLSGNVNNRHFEKIRTKAKLSKIRLYDLRHTNATMLLASGVSAKVVAERLGHSSVVLTLDTYSHVLPAMQTDATNRLENMMFGT
ncbi:MAG: site-specific integrase [Chloracidobacterium sp.]|nr:site-specific integrase [Chloracidobacterium sp.]